EHEGDQCHRRRSQGRAARRRGREPARSGRGGAGEQGSDGRLRLGHARHRLDDTSTGEARQLLAAADPTAKAGLEPAVGGYVVQKLSRPSTESSEVVGLAAAVVMLLLALGTATAMALPIVIAVLGLLVTLALITALGHATAVPTVAPTL